jgi:hypothetical protein
VYPVVVDETILTESATAYSVPESFDVVVQSVRRALAVDGFHVIAELDLSGYIERMLGIGMLACAALCVCSQGQLEEELVAAGAMPGLLPLHVVISARGSHTEIHILGLLPEEALPPRTYAPVTAIQTRLSRTLDRIAMRHPAFSLA